MHDWSTSTTQGWLISNMMDQWMLGAMNGIKMHIFDAL
jgi:hypothetical protein